MRSKEEIFRIIDESISDELLEQIHSSPHKNNLSGAIDSIVSKLFDKKERDVTYQDPVVTFDGRGNGKLVRGGFINLNDSYKERVVRDITEVFFINFYPRIMVRNKEDLRDEVDYPEIFDVLEVILDNKNGTKGTDLYIKLKTFMNCIYGYLTSTRSTVINITHDYISSAGREIMEDLYEKFKFCMIYGDTDHFFIQHFAEIESEFFEYSKKFELPIDIGEHHESGFFHGKKRYILGNFEKVKGFKIILV